jgi:5-methylcytosine-specific restriction endonuclease McrA
MPGSEESKKKYNSYMKEYMKNLYRKKKLEIIAHLGGKCAQCGTIINLQIDHKDPNKKNFSITDRWSIAWSKLIIELKLCQLLCHSCHLDKSSHEESFSRGDQHKPKFKHGTVWTYAQYECRCAACKQAKAISRKKNKGSK